MVQIRKTGYLFTMVCIVVFIFSSVNLFAEEKAAFSIEDSLRMKSFSAQSMTDDGRYIAGTLGISLDRLGTDHKRYGDPTYMSSRVAEVVILDTETKEFIPLFESKKQVRGMIWSPDGKILAFLFLKDDRFFLQTFDRTKNSLKEIRLKTDKAIASNSFLIWTNDGSRILLALRSAEWEERASSLYKEATEGPVIVYDSSEPFLKWDVIRNQSSYIVPAVVDVKSGDVRELGPENLYSSVRLSKDDSFITYSITTPVKTLYTRKREGEKSVLSRLDLKAGSEPQTLFQWEEKRLGFSWNEENTLFAWGDDGDIFLQSVEETESKNLTKDKVKPEKEKEPAEGEEKGEEKKVRFSMNRFSPDGKKLLAQTDKGYWLIDHQSGELEMVYEFPEKKEGAEESSTGRGSIQAWSLDGRYLYISYAAKDKWERGFTRYDLEERKMEDLVKDSNLYRGLRMSKDGQKFFYSFSNGDLPNEYVMTDKTLNNGTVLTNLNPWIKEKHLTRSELIKYLDADGNELYGVLYYPVNYEPGKKYPLVCEVYERFFDNGFNTNMNIITNQGWFGLRPSVNLEIGYPGESWVKGITSIINKLVEKDMVDPKKLGVHGTSYGGYAVSLLITQTDRFAAAVNISGKVNMVSFLGDSPRIGARNYTAAELSQDRIGASLWEQPFKYINHSAVFFADRVKTPHLLITGDGDWNVPAVNTREMYYALRRLGKECVWVNYFNDGHGLGAAESEEIYEDKWNRVLDWYKIHFEKADKDKEK
ncbi:prolyl oligopeptidase family serine peptidase [Acidobacteriota bacterium]